MPQISSVATNVINFTKARLKGTRRKPVLTNRRAITPIYTLTYGAAYINALQPCHRMASWLLVQRSLAGI